MIGYQNGVYFQPNSGAWLDRESTNKVSNNKRVTQYSSILKNFVQINRKQSKLTAFALSEYFSWFCVKLLINDLLKGLRVVQFCLSSPACD